MAIGETEHTAVVVAGGGKVDPGPIAGLGDGQARVLDAVFMLIEEHEGLGRRRILDLRVKMPAGRAPRVRVIVHVGIHRDAPKSRNLALIPYRRTICRAFVDFDGAVVAEKHAVFDVGAGRISPGVPVDPGVLCRDETFAIASGQCGIRGQGIPVVIHIHLPAKLKLLVIAETVNLLRLGLRIAQRWQQHSRENRNDGDDNEEFDQSKSPARYDRAWRSRRRRTRKSGREGRPRTL